MSTEVEFNPFRPDGELCKEAEDLLRNSTIQRDKVIINDPSMRHTNGGYLTSPDGTFSPMVDSSKPVETTVMASEVHPVSSSPSSCSPTKSGEVQSGQVTLQSGVIDNQQPMHDVEYVKIKSGGIKCCELL